MAHYNAGRRRWNNGTREISQHEHPGDGWVLGALPRTKEFEASRTAKISAICSDTKIYNNGEENIFVKNGEEPPTGYVLGMKPQSARKNKYTNGTEIIECLATNKPEGWIRVLNRKK